MKPLPHHYDAHLSGGPTGCATVSVPGVPGLRAAPPIEFEGPGDAWSPEHLLLAAVATCFLFTLRAVARACATGILVLDVPVEGAVDREDGVVRFTEIVLRPRLVLAPGQRPRPGGAGHGRRARRRASSPPPSRRPSASSLTRPNTLDRTLVGTADDGLPQPSAQRPARQSDLNRRRSARVTTASAAENRSMIAVHPNSQLTAAMSPRAATLTPSRSAPVAAERPCHRERIGDGNEQERGQKDRHSGRDGTRRPAHKVADERSRRENGSGRELADRHRINGCWSVGQWNRSTKSVREGQRRSRCHTPRSQSSGT